MSMGLVGDQDPGARSADDGGTDGPSEFPRTMYISGAGAYSGYCTWKPKPYLRHSANPMYLSTESSENASPSITSTSGYKSIYHADYNGNGGYCVSLDADMPKEDDTESLTFTDGGSGDGTATLIGVIYGSTRMVLTTHFTKSSKYDDTGTDLSDPADFSSWGSALTDTNLFDDDPTTYTSFQNTTVTEASYQVSQLTFTAAGLVVGGTHLRFMALASNQCKQGASYGPGTNQVWYYWDVLDEAWTAFPHWAGTDYNTGGSGDYTSRTYCGDIPIGRIINGSGITYIKCTTPAQSLWYHNYVRSHALLMWKGHNNPVD